MDHSRALRASVTPLPRDWHRRSGRPRHTWLRTIESDLAPLNIGLATAYHRAQNRQAWSKLVGTATSTIGQATWWWWWTSSQYPLLICCHSFSPANHLLENHRLLIKICITSSLESTSRFMPSASAVLSRFTSSSTYQRISHHPTVIIYHSFTLSRQAQTYLSTNPSHLRFLLPTGLPSW